jgi:hypothetical protein
MKTAIERKWMGIALLSVVVPVGMLVAFKFSDMFRGPNELSTIEYPVLNLDFERPCGMIDLNKSLHRTTLIGDEASVTSDFSIGHYSTNLDTLDLGINISASVSDGFVKNLHMIFEEDCNCSEIVWADLNSLYDKPPFTSYVIENLRYENHVHLTWGAGVKARLWLSGVNQPKAIRFTGFADWMFQHVENETHILHFRSELVYYNGTHYVKVVLPIETTIWPDAGDSFETAREITTGDQNGYLWVVEDPEDWYKIEVKNGQAIPLNATPAPQPGPWQDLEVYLYNPNKELVASAAESEIDYTPETLNYAADISGYWYIQIVKVRAGGGGLYRLSVNLAGESS